MMIRPATFNDRAAIWAVFEPVIRAGETFELPRDMTREAALAFWMPPGGDVFVAEAGGAVLGSYYLCAHRGARRAHVPNGPNGPGSPNGTNVANAGYITAVTATGRGVARSMCAHSIEHARTRGFHALQLNFVVSTNDRAVWLWQAMGFATVERLAGAFAHPTHGKVDAFVMYRTL